MDIQREAFSAPELTISVKAGQLAGFFQLLQQGVILGREVGCSVRSFLNHQLQLSNEFIEDYVQTVFLNGRPVDDLGAAFVKDGCTLALSSAMPGLVGATMRRGSYYASLRSQISHSSQEEIVPAAAKGFITLKLFNLVAEHLGKALLQNGVFVKKKDLADLLSRLPDSGPWMEKVLDGVLVDSNTFETAAGSSEFVHLRLKVQ